MHENLTSEGLTIAPGVVETMVSLTVSQIDGVAQVKAPSIPDSFMSALHKKHLSQGIIIMADDDGRITVSVHVHIFYGYQLQEVAQNIRQAVVETMEGQVGIQVFKVDVFVDGIQFPE